MKDNDLGIPPHGSYYFPYFDWLRFVLAAMVMLGHDQVLHAVWDTAPTFAVHVFFVLSGWLIGGILLTLSTAELPQFFFNRALRIWIPYYVAFALLIGASLVRDPLTTDWARVVVYKLTMVYNLFNGDEIVGGFKNAPLNGTGHHFWSVNAEEQFYLAAALLLVCLWHYGGRHWLLWALITVVTLFIGADYPGLSLGVLAAILLRRSDWHRTTKGRWVIALVLLVLLPFLFKPTTFMAVSPFVGLAIVLLLAVPGRQSRLGEVFGGLSYPLYLNHWIGIYVSNAVFKRLGITDAISWRHLVAAVSSLLFALLHYWLIDRQIKYHRHLWYSPRAGLLLMGSAYALFALGLVYGAAAMR